MRRIVVLGTTGSGKTTFSGKLSRVLDVPHIELDVLNWKPDWIMTPTEEFLRAVEAATSAPAWVVDGNYAKARSIIWPRADAVIWLDYPFFVTLFRLIGRTFRRLVFREKCCNGNHESLSKLFSNDSIILWAFRSHWRHRRDFERALNDPQYAHLQKIIFHSTQESEAWLEKIINGK